MCLLVFKTFWLNVVLPFLGSAMYNWQFWNCCCCSLHGWLLVQGCWSWGAVMTWHAERRPPFPPGMSWMLTLWGWSEQRGCWINTELEDVAEDGWNISPWMVHVPFQNSKAASLHFETERYFQSSLQGWHR